jgi:hypothetical protein
VTEGHALETLDVPWSEDKFLDLEGEGADSQFSSFEKSAGLTVIHGLDQEEWKGLSIASISYPDDLRDKRDAGVL